MDDSDIIDFMDSDRNFELPVSNHSCFGAKIEDQMNFLKCFIERSNLDADQKAQDSQLKLTKLDKDIAQRTKDIEEMTLKNMTLQRELEALNQEYDSMKDKESQEMKELIELETLCKNRKSFKLHPVDAQRFENLRFRLFACKSLTNIRWNYAESKDNKLVGYVCDTHTERIRKFNFDLDKTDKAAVSKQLWAMILACAVEKNQKSAHSAENKET